MWRLVVLCALVIFVAAGCGGSSETPLQQTSIPQPKEEVNLITQTPAQAADETNDAPVCRGEQAVPRGLLDRIETALEEASGVLSVVCLGALEDAPFIRVHVVVNWKAGVGRPVEEVEDSIEFERKGDDWEGYILFSWFKTQRQFDLENAVAEQTEVASRAVYEATRQEKLAARATLEASQTAQVIQAATQLSPKVGTASFSYNTRMPSGYPSLELRLVVLNPSDVPVNFGMEVVASYDGGRELLYQCNETQVSEYEQELAVICRPTGHILTSESEGSDVFTNDVIDSMQPVRLQFAFPDGSTSGWIQL